MIVIEVAGDECDACPSSAHVQAYVYAQHEDWPIGLSYCAHYGREYLNELLACGAVVVDMRHLLEDDHG